MKPGQRQTLVRLGLALALAAGAAWELTPPRPALAQVACTVLSQTALLASFADTAPAGSITPRNLRDLVCSIPSQALTGLGAAVVLAPVVSPFVYSPLVPGTLSVAGGLVEVSRNAGATWASVSASGGALPLLVGDTARVTWFRADPPGTVFLPGGV